jgi:hypothetical protein
MIFKLFEIETTNLDVSSVFFWNNSSWGAWQLLWWFTAAAVFICQIIAIWSELWWLALCRGARRMVGSNNEFSNGIVRFGGWWTNVLVMAFTMTWSQWRRFLNWVFIADINIKHGQSFWNLWSVWCSTVLLWAAWDFALDLNLDILGRWVWWCA